LDFALWTRDLVRQVIAKRFGVHLSVGSVGRILRGLGMSPQRPLHRATQQDPERVERWRTEEYPAIRDEAAQVGATVYFADEAGSVPTTTPAPRGRRSDRRRSWPPPAPDTRST
jgi:hypothetical protein